MCVGDRGERQFRLEPKRIEAWSVEHRKAVGQQRVRIIYYCITPCRHFDDFIFGGGIAGLVEHGNQAHHARVERIDALGVRKRLERLAHLRRRIDIQTDLAPLHRHVLQLGDRFVAVTRFHRQELQIRLFVGIVKYFGRAHGGAPHVGGQQPLLEIGEKQCVDKF